MRGFGRSPDPTCAYSRVEDVLGVLQDPKQKVHMVGTGMGGVVALEFALAQAGRTESVSVLGTGLPGHAWPTEAYMDISEPRKSGITQQLLGEPNDAMELVRWKQMFIERNETWDVLRKGDAHVGKALVKMARSYRGFHFFQYDPLEPDPMEVPPLVDRLGLVNVPVLVMVGTCDTKEFRAIAQEVVNGIDNTKGVVAVHEAGHFLTLEQPQCVAEELISFWHSLSNS